MHTRLIAAITASALAIVGCGDDGDGDAGDERTVAVPPDPFVAEAGEGVQPVEGDFTANQVIRAYQERIGMLLTVDRREPRRYVTLRPIAGPPFAPAAPDLGIFTLSVAVNEDEAEALIGESGIGEEQVTSERGVRFVADPGTVSARARFGNVVLDWNVEDDVAETDERFQRLADPLESLGGAEVPARPGMEACLALEAPAGSPEAGEGLDPSADEGTCRLGPQTTTFADSDSTLDFALADVRLVGDPEIRTELAHQREDLTVDPGPKKPPQPIRAEGEFVIVRVEVTNDGEEPLEGLRAGLVVEDALFTPDLDNAFYVDARNPPFPLEPGDTGELVLLFDVPSGLVVPPDDLASALSASGALVLVEPHSERSLDGPGNAPNVARLRLGS